MIAVLGLAFVVAFAAAQGAAIFVTAFLALRVLGIAHRAVRLPAMLISYAGWVGATVVGYAALGGEGGLMDGFGMLLMLCFTALISTSVYSAIWTVSPLFNREIVND
ncbi:hypothetical protein OK349_05380 [Sphingomonas sp. BT-65]|uniref:hypothetical protein n=1 Tax=Sphingomonas sp. BT-65 TaxID=2989821 RepID=UPI0022357986|nr:hypothetical protein [Sphingomonas sp. BT-65]MCW4461131.1 hypothetical protein [Sphingomonas sp. BT-65]